MSDFFTPHLEILPAAQQRLWPFLRPAPDLGLVLYGGTAITLRLGHRPSVDFDFFTDQPFNKRLLQSAFAFMADATVIQDQPESLTVLVKDEKSCDDYVKISFFGSIGFGRIGQPQTTDDGVLQVAAMEDLMATKLKVILQRVEAKDYRDIAAMTAAGVSLSRGLAGARQLFGVHFQPSESLKALVYFEGGDLHLLTHEERMLLIDAASVVRDLPQVQVASTELALRSGRYLGSN